MTLLMVLSNSEQDGTVTALISLLPESDNRVLYQQNVIMLKVSSSAPQITFKMFQYKHHLTHAIEKYRK
jgi:hypothetical protein